jgi:hypothetical protein
VFALLLLCACGSSEPPAASILSVAPQSISRSECALLSVELEGALPVKLDYGNDSAQMPALVKVAVGGRDVPVELVEQQGRRIAAHVFAGLPTGTHDVHVTLSDGQQLVLRDGIEVTGLLMLETFYIEPIPSQVREESFTVTIRAVGPDAQKFQGRVLLRSNKGKVEPEWSNPFQQGVLTQEVSVEASGGNNNLIIEMVDCEGRTVNSNEFRLAPKP